MTNGAGLLVRSLALAGVERLFTLSGNQIMPVFDACVDEPIDLIHVRHEAAAVHMADAWGRLTGRPGVALVTAGPGFSNTLSAMFQALGAESPLVVLSGCSPTSQRGQGAFQEMAQAEMAGHVSKASWTVEAADRIGHDLARAMRTAASGRPGPVHLSLPFDLLNENVERAPQATPSADDFHPSYTLLDVRTAAIVLEKIAAASRPVILTGPMTTCVDGPALCRRVADALNVPVIPMDGPRSVNDPALGAIAEVLPQADLLVLVGKKLDYMLKFGGPPAIASDCRVIQLDPERAVLEQTARLLEGTGRFELADVADAHACLERLIESAGDRRHARDEWRANFEQAVAYRPGAWDEIDDATNEGGERIHPATVGRAISRFLESGDEAVFIADGGEFGQWVQACAPAGVPRIINGPAGMIGGAIPFALAARLAFPDARIVVALGDGTFGFHPMEFDTAVRYRLPFVTVVGNDACWNAERQIQIRDYGPERQIGCDLLPTRYDEVVQAMGGWGRRVTGGDVVAAAIEEAHASERPACLNVEIEGAPAPIVRR